MVDSLLRVLNGMGGKAVGYADDIAILARGGYEEVLRDVGQGALKATEEWCSSKVLQIQRDKSVALIFTKRYKIRKLRSYFLAKQRGVGCKVGSGSTANALDLLHHYCAEVNICLNSLVKQNTAEHGL